MASYCFLKSGGNANIGILKSFPWARGCCVHVFLVVIVIVVAFGVEVLAKAGFGYRCYLGWLWCCRQAWISLAWSSKNNTGKLVMHKNINVLAFKSFQ